jgi:hypothetical protein
MEIFISATSFNLQLARQTGGFAPTLCFLAAAAPRQAVGTACSRVTVIHVVGGARPLTQAHTAGRVGRVTLPHLQATRLTTSGLAPNNQTWLSGNHPCMPTFQTDNQIFLLLRFESFNTLDT